MKQKLLASSIGRQRPGDADQLFMAFVADSFATQRRVCNADKVWNKSDAPTVVRV